MSRTRQPLRRLPGITQEGDVKAAVAILAGCGGGATRMLAVDLVATVAVSVTQTMDDIEA